jgi:hypothetical protein
MPEKLDTAIRDRLARQRTELANERTLLSYIRTAWGKENGSGVFVDRLVRLGRTSLSPKRRWYRAVATDKIHGKANAGEFLWLMPFMSSCRTGTLPPGSLTIHVGQTEGEA